MSGAGRLAGAGYPFIRQRDAERWIPEPRPSADLGYDARRKQGARLIPGQQQREDPARFPQAFVDCGVTGPKRQRVFAQQVQIEKAGPGPSGGRRKPEGAEFAGPTS